MKVNQSVIGKYYKLQEGTLYVINANGDFAGVQVTSDAASYTVKVQLTGGYLNTARGNTMYMTTTGHYIDLKDGWEEVGQGQIHQYSQSDAQQLVNKIIKDNITILQNNLLCARFANKLTDDQKWQLKELQSRLEARDASLRKDGLCTELKESYPQGYIKFATDLQQIEESTPAVNGVGVIATATIGWIIIGAIVATYLAYQAYYAYKRMAVESAEDVQFSNELTKTLTSKLTAAEYQQLKEETAGIVTKAKIYNRISGATSFIKYGLIAAGAFIGINYIRKLFNKQD